MDPQQVAVEESNQAYSTVPLDEELAAGLVRFPPLPDFLDIDHSRKAFRSLLEARPRKPDLHGVKVRDHLIDGPPEATEKLRVRVYRPDLNAALALPVICYMHAGGYIFGTPEDEDEIAAHLVRSLGCIVASVDYRLAPEHPYPAALDDCYAALKWLVSPSQKLGVDCQRLVVGGRSAGGGLAASLALLARDRGEIEVCFQWLIYPMLDDRTNCAEANRSGRCMTDQRLWNHSLNERAWAAYLGRSATETTISQYAAPARAVDLSNLPPAFIAVGSAEIFADECVDYARRLKLAGVTIQLCEYPGAFHLWESSLPRAAISLKQLNERTAALARVFRPSQ